MKREEEWSPMWNRGTRASNVFNGVKLWKRWSFYGRDEVNILPRQVSAGREIKQWKAGYYGLTIISATWLPLYCSIHASDVYCNCTNNLLPTTYAGRSVDQLGNVRSFHRRRFNAFLRLLLAGVLLFQLFEYWGIKVGSLRLDENVWLYESARIPGILRSSTLCQK